MNVRRRRLRSPGFTQNASAFNQFYFGGKDSRLGVRVAWVLVGMDCHYLNSPCPASLLTTGGQSDGLCSQPTTLAARKSSSN